MGNYADTPHILNLHTGTMNIRNFRKNPEGTIRLARWLRLNIKGMSQGQIARLVRWRITRGQASY